MVSSIHRNPNQLEDVNQILPSNSRSQGGLDGRVVAHIREEGRFQAGENLLIFGIVSLVSLVVVGVLYIIGRFYGPVLGNEPIALLRAQNDQEEREQIAMAVRLSTVDYENTVDTKFENAVLRITGSDKTTVLRYIQEIQTEFDKKGNRCKGLPLGYENVREMFEQGDGVAMTLLPRWILLDYFKDTIDQLPLFMRTSQEESPFIVKGSQSVPNPSRFAQEVNKLKTRYQALNQYSKDEFDNRIFQGIGCVELESFTNPASSNQQGADEIALALWRDVTSLVSTRITQGNVNYCALIRHLVDYS